MDFTQAFVLSLVEGITEFLPISSTGHLILASKLLNITQSEFVKTFEIVIQLGAILSVGLLYWQKLLKNWQILKRVIWVFVPTGVLGFLLYKIIKDLLLGNSLITALALIIGGILIIIFERYFKQSLKSSLRSDYKQHEGKLTIEDLNLQKALTLGVIQTISVIPGVSRAGATIFGGMFLGLSREAATELSFLVAFPVIAAASLYDLYKSRDTILSSDLGVLIFGMIISFIVSLLVIKWLLNYVKKHDLTLFGIYRIVVGLLFLLLIK